MSQKQALVTSTDRNNHHPCSLKTSDDRVCRRKRLSDARARNITPLIHVCFLVARWSTTSIRWRGGCRWVISHPDVECPTVFLSVPPRKPRRNWQVLRPCVYFALEGSLIFLSKGLAWFAKSYGCSDPPISNFAQVSIQTCAHLRPVVIAVCGLFPFRHSVRLAEQAAHLQ